MRKLACIVILIFLFSSCEEVVFWEPGTLEEDRIVIEAILTDEFRQQEISLSGLKDSLNGESGAISGAFISVKDASNEYLFWEDPQSPGLYKSTIPFAIESYKRYSLSVDWKNNRYEAEASGVPSYPMRDFPFVPFQEKDSMSIGGLGVDYSEQEQAMYEFIIDWNNILPGDTTRAKLLHFVFNAINIAQLFGPEQEFFVFPKGSIVYKSKYALSDDYAVYLRSLVIESKWKGGFFEESSGNLPSNISNGALGYFAVCTVQRDTIIAQ
jgi:hypothetical protein